MREEVEQEQVDVKTKGKLKKIKPLKDFKFVMNKFSYDMKKGEEIEVHKMFLPNLKTEKVIK